MRSIATRAKELERSVQIQSAMLQSMSHDFRTPLAVIASASAGLRNPGGMTDQERRELVDHLDASVASLQHLIGGLLDLHRIEAGVTGLRLEAVDLLEALAMPLSSVQRVIDLDIPDDFPPLLADRTLLERILRNLLRNADKHTAPDAPVSVTAGRTRGWALVQVIDHGEGIPEERYDEMFEPFRRFETDVQGLGLGLSIAQAFAQAMGMQLSPTATPGGGLTMTVKARVAGDTTADR